MDVKTIQNQIRTKGYSSRLNRNFNTRQDSPARSRSAQRERFPAKDKKRLTAVPGVQSGARPIKDAHERFRDRILHGRDIEDVEEELSTERAKNVQYENVMKMKESQMLKYQKGLEKAKGILKSMVASTEEKMGKLQQRVDSLQSTLEQRERQLREKTRECQSLESNSTNYTQQTDAIAIENRKLHEELESYRSRSKKHADRFEGRQQELYAKYQDLSQSNHRLTGEMSHLQTQLQRRIKEDQEKIAEIERLQMHIIELEGGSLSDAQARRLTLAQAKREIEQLESRLANTQSLIDDAEFFISVKNELDDLNEVFSNPDTSEVRQESIMLPQLKCLPTFERLLETNETNALLDTFQKLAREVEEDRVNCRRALKDLQNKAYVVAHSYDEQIASARNLQASGVAFTGAFGDLELSIAQVCDGLNDVEIYGDIRDQDVHEPPVNKILSGFREGKEKDNPLRFNTIAQRA